MKRLHIILFLAAACAALLSQGCTKDPSTGGGPADGEGSLLNLAVSFDGMGGTRLAELGSVQNINDSVVNGKNYGLNNIGLYVYYKTDYYSGSNGDLTKPYIRNMECYVDDNNTLVPVQEPGQPESDRNIYIYDEMVVVAFYPYNADMTDPANHFATRSDEKNYYIRRKDYREQYYIPYRAITETDPTVSYYTPLTFYPRGTYKVEIVVVSDDTGDFVGADEVVILPNIDPITTEDTSVDGRREKWYDGTPASYVDRGGGSNVMQYWTYIWTGDDDLNDIPQGEILLQAGRLTLIASQDVPVQEQHVYRYGYNMSTGEIFIPTSTNLVWDAQSLADYEGSSSKIAGSVYQVCDIDLEGRSWTPNTLRNARYDGGGHKIENLVVNSSDSNAGLFSRVTYNSTVCNVNLIEPRITVTSADTVSVGAICGQLSDVLSDEDIAQLTFNLPDDLSPVVKAAIIAEMLKDAYNGTSRIVGCRVEEPTISVNALAPRVGTIAGETGAKNEDGEYKAVIKDTYSLGGNITVNDGAEENNEGGYAGGFVGLNHGSIIRSYTTIADGSITFNIPDAVTGDPVPSYAGFTTSETLFDSAGDMTLTDNYSVIADAGGNAAQMPGSWPSWSSETPWWPVLTTGWIDGNNSYWYSAGSAPVNYPILQWERR